MLRRTLPLLAATLVLTGCQTWGPTWSEVTGRRFTHTTLNRMPTIIEHIDGRSAFPTDPIRIEPGKRTLTLQGVPVTPGWRGTLQVFLLDAAPCQRYYVTAQFESRLTTSRWEPVIDHVEPIAGCSVVATK